MTATNQTVTQFTRLVVRPRTTKDGVSVEAQMNANFPAKAMAASEMLSVVRRYVHELSGETNDHLTLERLDTIDKDLALTSGYLDFVVLRARVQLKQEERQKDLIIRQYQASIDAREVTK